MNPTDKISKYFTVKEALWLPSWNKLHTPTPEELNTIKKWAATLDLVREFLSAPMIIHCWLRPTEYNKAIGGSVKSAHIKGNATDFHVKGYESAEGCKKIREKLIPLLDKLGIRMEDKDGTWIHLDSNPVIHRRFFKP